MKKKVKKSKSKGITYKQFEDIVTLALKPKKLLKRKDVRKNPDDYTDKKTH